MMPVRFGLKISLRGTRTVELRNQCLALALEILIVPLGDLSSQPSLTIAKPLRHFKEFGAAGDSDVDVMVGQVSTHYPFSVAVALACKDVHVGIGIALRCKMPYEV